MIKRFGMRLQFLGSIEKNLVGTRRLGCLRLEFLFAGFCPPRAWFQVVFVGGKVAQVAHDISQNCINLTRIWGKQR
jgi:hypothetical protein